MTLVGCYAPNPQAGSPCQDNGVCASGLVCSPATLTCEETAVEVPDAALDASSDSGDWAYRVPITFDAAAAATDAIVLIVLDGTFPYAHTAAGGADIRIGDELQGNGFEAAHWLEDWDPDGESRVWARVPAVVAGTNTIFAYYGNATVPTTDSFDAVFVDTLRTTADGTFGGAITRDAVLVEMGHTITVTPGAPLDITAAYVRVSGILDGDAAGHPGAMGPGAGGPSTNGGAGGGGHGGVGGLGGGEAGDIRGPGGVTYGEPMSETVDMGSGGGTTDQVLVGAIGGGAIRIAATRIIVRGTIRARGQAGTGDTRSGGGGGGGGVLLNASSIEHTGAISVAGGAGGPGPAAGNDGGGGGGGGRIKLFHRGDLVNMGTVNATFGIGGSGGDDAPGQPGVVGSSFVGTSTLAKPLPVVGAEQTL